MRLSVPQRRHAKAAKGDKRSAAAAAAHAPAAVPSREPRRLELVAGVPEKGKARLSPRSSGDSTRQKLQQQYLKQQQTTGACMRDSGGPASAVLWDRTIPPRASKELLHEASTEEVSPSVSFRLLLHSLSSLRLGSCSPREQAVQSAHRLKGEETAETCLLEKAWDYCLSAGLYCPLPQGYLDFSNYEKKDEEEEEIDDPSSASLVPPKVTLQWLDELAEAFRGKRGGGRGLPPGIAPSPREESLLQSSSRCPKEPQSSALSSRMQEARAAVLLLLLLLLLGAGLLLRDTSAARRHKGLRRLCLPHVSLVGLEAVVTLVRRNRTLEELELAIHSAPPPLTAVSDVGLADPEERRGPQRGPLPLLPTQPKSSSKKTKRHLMRVANEKEDEALSLTGEGDEETVESSSDSVERLLRCRYIEEAKGLLLELFHAYEEAQSLCLLSVGGVGDDPDLHRLVLSFDQLTSQRQLAREKQLASEDERETEKQLAGRQRGGKRTGGPSPVPPRLYFSTMLEGPLTQAVVALAKAKGDNPEAVDSSSKELAFLAKHLYEAC
ncbi:hypothetical protein Emag_003292 [Eimeria magna]